MKKTSAVWLVLIQFVLAYEWLHSGWGKWSAPGFMNNIGTALAGYVTKTPYPWYADFLSATAVQNAALFGNLIRGGELLAGIAFLIGGLLFLTKKRLSREACWLLVAANLGGAFMNLNFYLAAGSTSPSTAGINVTMFFIQLILAGFYASSRRQLSA